MSYKAWFLDHKFKLDHILENTPGSASGKESACQCKRLRFDPRVRKIPWRRKWQPTAVFLPGESHRPRNLTGCSPWGHEELDATEATLHAHTLLQSMGFRART